MEKYRKKPVIIDESVTYTRDFNRVRIHTERKIKMINIEGMDKAKVLKALYDNSHVQGLGFMSALDNFTENDARELMKTQPDFDYLYGRIMKIDLSANEFEEWLYDRDNGAGAAQRAVDSVKNDG